VSDVVNKKTAKFTIDTPVEMAGRVGKPVKPAARQQVFRRTCQALPGAGPGACGNLIDECD
jgi:hypothetical protein